MRHAWLIPLVICRWRHNFHHHWANFSKEKKPPKYSLLVLYTVCSFCRTISPRTFQFSFTLGSECNILL